MTSTPRGNVNTQGTTPLANTSSGAAGTVTGTERSKLQTLLDIRSLAADLILSGTQLTIRLATAAVNGLMSAADKAKLDAATNANTANALVMRDGAGGFSAGTITATLNGNATTATTAGSATSATNATKADSMTRYNGTPVYAQKVFINGGFALTPGQVYTEPVIGQPVGCLALFATQAEGANTAKTHAVTPSVNPITGEVTMNRASGGGITVTNSRSDQVYVYCLVFYE